MFIIADTRTGYMGRLSRRAFYDAVKYVRNKRGEWGPDNWDQKAKALAENPGSPIIKKKFPKPTVDPRKGIWRSPSKVRPATPEERAHVAELNKTKRAPVKKDYEKYIKESWHSYNKALENYKLLLAGGGFAEKIVTANLIQKKLEAAMNVEKALSAVVDSLTTAYKSLNAKGGAI